MCVAIDGQETSATDHDRTCGLANGIVWDVRIPTNTNTGREIFFSQVLQQPYLSNIHIVAATSWEYMPETFENIKLRTIGNGGI